MRVVMFLYASGLLSLGASSENGLRTTIMKLFALNHHHCETPWDSAPPYALELREMLSLILQKENILMVDYTKLTADITAQTTVLQSVVVGVQGLNAANATLATQVATLQAAVTAKGDPALQAAADAVDATVQANTALVANLIPAVTANTPTTAPVAAAAAAAAASPPAA